ncbi:Protein of unknown function [Pyronema omphalodes CBS 100304]|uniref:Uncharacterized protein n=1 Tax=Pyronema omphalodes (strain CBS 100304) TaxID=1076935 RepID=U4LTM2_PYROM|nr:Protein of unknown function [Pyronema omphalodes CBS 100304]
MSFLYTSITICCLSSNIANSLLHFSRRFAFSSSSSLVSKYDQKSMFPLDILKSCVQSSLGLVPSGASSRLDLSCLPNSSKDEAEVSAMKSIREVAFVSS